MGLASQWKEQPCQGLPRGGVAGLRHRKVFARRQNRRSTLGRAGKDHPPHTQEGTACIRRPAETPPAGCASVLGGARRGGGASSILAGWRGSVTQAEEQQGRVRLGRTRWLSVFLWAHSILLGAHFPRLWSESTGPDATRGTSSLTEPRFHDPGGRSSTPVSLSSELK